MIVNAGKYTSLLIRNAKVASSTPASGTIKIKHLAQLERLGFLFSGLCLGHAPPLPSVVGQNYPAVTQPYTGLANQPQRKVDGFGTLFPETTRIY